jgi:hypothetical protein
MTEMTLERRLDERRGPARRRTDVQRALVEESLKELPRYFVSYADPVAGLFTFYCGNLEDARLTVAELKEQGIAPENIGLYARDES